MSGLGSGVYSVTATDTWGCSESGSFVITAPAAIPSVINSSGSLAMCTGDSRVLSLVGFASTANTYQWSDASGVISGATSSTYTINDAGSYSLEVTNSNGCVVTSNTIDITVISTSAPSSLSASNIGLDRFTMNWGAVTDAHHYDIRMRIEGGSWSVFFNNISPSLTSKMKVNLQSDTTYEWSIRSACNLDTSSSSAWSSVQSVSTLTPCTVPVNSIVSGITLTAATLGWDAIAGSWGYRVRYKKTTDPWSSWSYETVNTNSYSLTGLTTGASYHWQVEGVCDATGINLVKGLLRYKQLLIRKFLPSIII